MAILLDATNMFGDVVSGGVPVAEWETMVDDFPHVLAGVTSLRDSGVLGFLDLPGNAALHQATRDFADRAFRKFDDVVVLGIGGSALGPIAMRTALLAPNWNALSGEE